MLRIYLYPLTKRNNTGIINPYINLLAEGLSKKFEIVNFKSPSDRGLLDILNYIKRTDIVFFNWIEDLPDKHLGILQTFFFFLLFPYLKLSGKKVIWTLHNKRSHTNKKIFLKRIIFNILLAKSDLILTHAKEGLKNIPSKTPAVFFPHPVKKDKIIKCYPKRDYDILIWGTISKYKGIDGFIRFIAKSNQIRKYKILIAGKITDAKLENFLCNMAKKYPDLNIINNFIEDEDLHEMIKSTKSVIFTYHSNSVLSSGALMDTIPYETKIIGPCTGAFRDMKDEGVLECFTDYKDLLLKIDKVINSPKNTNSLNELDNFLKNNTWSVFSNKLGEEMLNRLF